MGDGIACFVGAFLSVVTNFFVVFCIGYRAVSVGGGDAFDGLWWLGWMVAVMKR